jgi:hypothetical protein
MDLAIRQQQHSKTTSKEAPLRTVLAMCTSSIVDAYYLLQGRHHNNGRFVPLSPKKSPLSVVPISVLNSIRVKSATVFSCSVHGP